MVATTNRYVLNYVVAATSAHNAKEVSEFIHDYAYHDILVKRGSHNQNSHQLFKVRTLIA